ncbi:[Pyruvate dehydrogenase (acetyl-transferring)] kinase 2, mitochondrial [[Candida] railenensis]|uniref:Protein-serine/threonine kinase n=1 Tax=[Candida] railenensis TaxID=45579 RepID=A0A9P0QVK7_9ASCO|nr:[Pyruvate dehydrogenase (acetyl-transferring)] kinase 2, mitochondrial [[Candida] railenensis]
MNLCIEFPIFQLPLNSEKVLQFQSMSKIKSPIYHTVRHGCRRISTSSGSGSTIDPDLALLNSSELSSHLLELGPFPSFSSILNQQHFYQNEVLMKYSRKDPHPVSLRQLAGYGKTLTKQKIIHSANFVRLELPIRLAMRIRDLQTLPFGVVNNFHLAQIYESYYHSFNAFRKIGTINTLDDNDKFCETLSSLLDDHVFNLPHLMMGALEVSILTDLPQNELDQFMSSMIRSRISRRVIVEEHLSLTDNYKTSPYSTKPPDFIGEIFAQCNAAEELKIVSGVIKKSMVDIYPDVNKMPELEIDGDLNSTFPFMVPHLHYLFGEILRNSYEATINKYKDVEFGEKMPPIKITIIDSNQDVIFRISDQGGGIPHDKLNGVWSFMKPLNIAKNSLENFHRIPGLQLYHNLKVTPGGSSIVGGSKDKEEVLNNSSLTEPHKQTDSPRGEDKQSTLSALVNRGGEFKFGLGLPMCKVYTDYWNGDLSMNSLEGYGSDTCLTLKKLGLHSNVTQLDRA